MNDWRERWQGASLNEKYSLEAWLGDDDGAAFFQTSLTPAGPHAVVKLVPAASVDGPALFNLWSRIRQLRHPNLVELLDCGQASLDGELAFYALFEAPDDTLTSALRRAPLNPQESREILDSILDALRYLHAQGLAAGALDSDHVVAIGERVKLSTGALREAETSAAYRDDVASLGRLWQRSLIPASPHSAELAAHAADPNPETRWTLAELSAALAETHQPEPAPPPPPPPVVEAPQLHATPTLQPPHPRTPPRWILFAAAALVLLLVAIYGLRPAKPTAPAPLAAAPLPQKIDDSKPSPMAALPKPTAATAPRPTVDPPTPSSSGGEKIWRVVAFTYRTREAAAHKADQLNEFHPGIDAAVFLPNDDGRYYLVALGGRMTRDQADRLQRTAKGRGLPRDLYVQNYTR